MIYRSLSSKAAIAARPALCSWLGWLVIVLALSGCNEPAGEATIAPRPATPIPQPPAGAATATVAAPSSTPAPVLQPSATTEVTPSPTPCAYDYFFTPAPPLCPREAAMESAAAEQPFTGGVMIWLESAGAIYVFFPDGQWQRFADTWTEAEAESDPTLTPPAGLYQPIRGFGKVWREHAGVRERLGWATSVELGYTSAVQRPVSETGEEILFLRTYNGQVFYLNEVQPGRGTWGIAASG
jgi:hypothetical protein